MKDGRLKRPIFFVGVPRSGTTILFEAFACHHDLAWLSSYSGRFPNMPFLNGLRRLLDNRWIQVTGKKEQHSAVAIGNRYLPKPDEAYPFWNQHCAVPFARSYMLEVEANAPSRERLRTAIDAVVKWQGKDRFATKITGPTRIDFLRSVFPDALFVHVIRDVRAVVDSLMRVGFWERGGGLTKPYWDGGLSDEYLNLWSESGKDPMILAALQWRNIIELARMEAKQLEERQYLEVKYEDFVEDPHSTLRTLYEFCKLPDSSAAHQKLDGDRELENMNFKYLENMSAEEVQRITACAREMLIELQYLS